MFANSVLRDAARNPIWQEAGGRLRVAVATVPVRTGHSRALSFKGVWDEWRADAGIAGYRWGGPALPWNPGSGILPFRLHIAAPGRYRLALRTSDEGEGGGCFVRIDRGQWWITRGAAAPGWTWETLRETGPDATAPWEADLDAGFHLIEISGRTPGHRVSDLALIAAADGADPDGLPHSAARPR